MTLTCPHCACTIEIEQPYPYHAGFSDEGSLYCDSCSAILVFGSYNPYYARLVPGKHPWCLTDREKRLVEAHLRACSCGGRFRFDLPPRCPECGGSLAELLGGDIYYICIGAKVDADADTSAWI